MNFSDVQSSLIRRVKMLELDKLYDRPFLVDGCKFCEIIKSKRPPTKLYYPEPHRIGERMLIIIDCPFNHKPVVVASEHIPDVDKTRWGYMLYHARRLFGQGIYLKIDRRYEPDHFHAYIQHGVVDPKKLPDLRKRI